MPSAPTVTLELRHSRIQRRFTAALIVLTGTGLLFAPWSWPVRLSTVIGYAIVVFAVFDAIRRLPTVRSIQWHSDGSWWIDDGMDGKGGDGGANVVELRAHHIAGPLLTLRFAPVGTYGYRRRLHWRTLTLWPDSADADAMRRLRLRLVRLNSGNEGSRPTERLG